MAGAWSRDDISELLHELASRLHRRGVTAGIRLVGGAALAIAYYDRRATADIDAAFSPSGPVLDVVAEIAAERNLPADWLNDSALGYIPFVGLDDWVEVFRDGGVVVSVGRAEMLLAMKLAANRGRPSCRRLPFPVSKRISRPGRDGAARRGRPTTDQRRRACNSRGAPRRCPAR